MKYRTRKELMSRLNTIRTEFKKIEEDNISLFIGAELTYFKQTLQGISKITAGNHRRSVESRNFLD